MVKAKRVYDESSPGDGLRVLTMRLWPRGIAKARVDVWLKDLGAELSNLRAYKAGTIDWPEMARRYRAGLAEPAAAAALARLQALARTQTVTVMCGCEDEARCHRGILKEILAGERTARRPARGPAA